MADELEPTAEEEVAVEVVEVVEEAPAVEEIVEVVEAPKTTSKKKSSAPVAVEEVANPGGIYEDTGLTEAEVQAQAGTPAVVPTQTTGMISFSSRNK